MSDDREMNVFQVETVLSKGKYENADRNLSCYLEAIMDKWGRRYSVSGFWVRIEDQKEGEENPHYVFDRIFIEKGVDLQQVSFEKLSVVVFPYWSTKEKKMGRVRAIAKLGLESQSLSFSNFSFREYDNGLLGFFPGFDSAYGVPYCP